MAVTLLRVLVLGVITAAADDVPITWWSSSSATLSCVVPHADRIPTRHPPPPLNAEDTSPPEHPYLWWKGGVEIERVLGNGSLVIFKRNGNAEGVYQCAVRHPEGLVLGYPVHLKFAYLDKQISVHPKNATAWIGQPYVLGCDINSGPAAIVTWQRNAESLPKNDRYFVLNNQLLIIDVKREDAGLYKCKAKNPQTNKTRSSHVSSLQVKDFLGDREEALAMLDVQYDSNIVGTKGQDVILPCPVTGYPRPQLLWLHTPPGERTGELEPVDEVLTLRDLDHYHQGVYKCIVEGHQELNKTFKVTVAVPVNITVPPTSKHTHRASTVRFNCTATGSPTPTVTWYKNGEPLVLAGRFAVRPSAGGGERLELIVRSVISEDAGVYQCFANNSHSMSSSWAVLNVTGVSAPPPTGVSCASVDSRHVLLRWLPVNNSKAYIVYISTPGADSLSRQPHMNTEEIITLKQELTPYNFQVQAFIMLPNNKSILSDISMAVTCQGHGVPIEFRRNGDAINVTWQQFSKQNSGVKQWILQYKTENSTNEHNITLGPTVDSYTLTVPSSSSVRLRVLGTRDLPWLHQNLTLVPWTSAYNIQPDLDTGNFTPKLENVEITELRSTEFIIRWQMKGANSFDNSIYMVCISNLDDESDYKEKCIESVANSVAVKGLSPSSKYAVRVKALNPSHYLITQLAEPIYISTPPEDAGNIKDLTYKLINSSTLRISWNSMPDKFIVYYSNDLSMDFDQGQSQETFGNTILLTGVDMSKDLYVKVSRYEPIGESPVLHIPVLVPEAKNLRYTFISSGVRVTWNGKGDRTVRYSQNLTETLEKWSTINVTADSVEITGLNNSLPTYVMVRAPGQSAAQVLNIPARPLPNPLVVDYGVVIGCGLVILCVVLMVLMAALCIWRRKKRTSSPSRSRRRNECLTGGHTEDGTELQLTGGRLANGSGSKDAGEPLLNGHVHITENPNATKAPNGRLCKDNRYEATFDVARYDDPDTTMDTVLDDTSSTTFNLLDTSRRPVYDLSRSSRNLSGNNSFHKLPDDNMNSELTRSTDFQLDNSKILPTLQPNG